MGVTRVCTKYFLLNTGKQLHARNLKIYIYLNNSVIPEKINTIFFLIFFLSAICDKYYHNLSLVKLCKNYLLRGVLHQKTINLCSRRYNLCSRTCRAPSWLISFISRCWLQCSEIRFSLASSCKHTRLKFMTDIMANQGGCWRRFGEACIIKHKIMGFQRNKQESCPRCKKAIVSQKRK